MRSTQIFAGFGLFFCLVISVSCNDAKPVAKDACLSPGRYADLDMQSRIITTPAPEWAEMLRHDKGWIGADGIYSAATNGVETPGKAAATNTFFWFSDCIIGNIVADTLQKDWQM